MPKDTGYFGEDLMDWLTADLEWKMQFARKLDCICSTYMMNNRVRILPNLVKASVEQKEDVDDVIARFVRNLHQRHLGGESIFTK